MNIHCDNIIKKSTPFAEVTIGDVFYDCNYDKPLIKISEQAAFSPDDNAVHQFLPHGTVIVVPSFLNVEFDNPYDR